MEYGNGRNESVSLPDCKTLSLVGFIDYRRLSLWLGWILADHHPHLVLDPVGVSRERVDYIEESTHITICKFSSYEGQRYFTVKSALQILVDEAVEVNNSTQTEAITTAVLSMSE